MQLTILALLASTAASQLTARISTRISQCTPHKFPGACYANNACTWRTGHCYSKSFATGASTSGSSEEHVAPAVYLPHGPSLSSDESPPNLDRRAMGTMLGAGALGWSLGSAQSAKAASDVPLVTFDGTPATTYTWSIVRGTAIDSDDKKNKLLKFYGTAAVNSFRESVDQTVLSTISGKPFADVSSCEGISLVVKNGDTLTARKAFETGGGEITQKFTPYEGYAISIGKKGGKAFSKNWGYKARFKAPVGEFGTVKIPFKDFTNSFDPVNGDPIEMVNPDPKTLENVGQIALWAEKVTGIFSLKVQEIGAYGCKSVAEEELSTFNGVDGTSLFLLFSAISLGAVVFFVVRIRARKAPVAPPLLG